MRAILLAALSSVSFAPSAPAQYAAEPGQYGGYGTERPPYLRSIDADESEDGGEEGDKGPRQYPPPPRRALDNEDQWRRPEPAPRVIERERIERERVVQEPPRIIERERIVRAPPQVIVRERVIQAPPQVIIRDRPVVIREHVYVGAVIPDHVVLRPYVGEPRFAGYRYANDAFGRRIIVEPRHRRVVRVVPY